MTFAIETAAARDDDEDDEDEAREEDAEAHEDYSCTRRSSAWRATSRRRCDDGWTARRRRRELRARVHRNHGLHWRKEAYGCELFVDETWFDVDDGGRAETDVDAGGAGEAGTTLGEYLSAATRPGGFGDGGIYAEETIHRRVGSRDVFDAPCVVLVRPVSASGQFVDVDEALTVRSAFVLASAGGSASAEAMAIVSPRGYHERDFTGDVCDKVGGDAVLETDVTRFTRMSARDEPRRRERLSVL